LVNNGASIVIESGAKLLVEGDVTNNGTITNNGELEIQGDLNNDDQITSNNGSKIIFSGSGNSIIYSANPLSFVELVLNKANGATTTVDAVDGNDIAMIGKVRFLDNNFLVLSDHDLSLANIASPIESAGTDRYIATGGEGKVIHPALGTFSSFTYPIGASTGEYNPITVTNNAAPAVIGARSLAEAYTIADDSNSGPAGDAVKASWQVTGGTDLDIEVNWVAGDQPASYDPDISGVARWDDVNNFWDLTIDDGLGLTGTSATRSDVSPGYFAVGGESVMDFILILPKVILSGAYNSGSGTMRTDLAASTLIPGGEPYEGLGFTHKGLGGGETSADFTGVVDWVFVEIRDGNDPTRIIGTCSALLKSNGDIVPTSSASDLKMPGFDSSKSYYVAIHHRNHLAVMSDNPISASRNSTVSYDLINNDVYGTNGAQFSNSVYQMWPGDVNGDGEIKYVGAGNDRASILSLIGSSDLTRTVTGYSPEDVNLDGEANYVGAGNDRAIILSIIGSADLTKSISNQIPE
jgi:hypothetical protein